MNDIITFGFLAKLIGAFLSWRRALKKGGLVLQDLLFNSFDVFWWPFNDFKVRLLAELSNLHAVLMGKNDELSW